MFEMIRLLFLIYSGQVSFLSIIERKYSKESKSYRIIAEAHALVEKIFMHVYRQTGEQYILHLEATAIICMVLLERMGKDDANVIVAALLHDLLEDRKDWTYARLKRKFGKDVASLVQWVSKRIVSHFNGNEEQQEKAFKEQLERAPVRAQMIKLADQSHNLLTLWGKTADKQRLKIVLARGFYQPLARKTNVLAFELNLIIGYATALLKLKSITGLFLLPRLR